ncbi:MAG: indole-3-glycerol phosphate synthase TrpC [Prolixibacteraceae bacterium]|nr:indole-3-glycerol phosphate synthase TrpC [Prolixibacteraceae bacterium]
MAQINDNKRFEVERAKVHVPLEKLMRFPFYHKPVPSLKEFLLKPDKSGIIAEHKRQSPSKGIINAEVKLRNVVIGYENAGASAVSVLTDEKYFGGRLTDLEEAASILNIPILRKDFMIDPYQVHEAKAYGASAILLIAASLTSSEVDALAKLAHELGLEVLFEVHNAMELEKISPHVDVVGVNNRNLKTFEVDINQSKLLANLIPENFVKISESGISEPATIRDLKSFGYQGFLMGENFMKTYNPGETCRLFIEEI